MYRTHFGLTKSPFMLTPNTEFFYNLPGHKEALNVLLFSLQSGEGFIKITGEVGVGKTLLCRKLLNTLPENYITCYLPNPDLTPVALRKAVAYELGINVTPDMDEHTLLMAITNHLLAVRREGRYVVLIIDEAQALSDDSLEAVRLLTNLETESEKLLQIVLFAQPELDVRLDTHKFRQLKQRIIFSQELQPIHCEDMPDYISHRLIVAGHTHGNLFTEKACDLLFFQSEGLPRVINILAHKAMLSAYGRNEVKVGKRAVMDAILDAGKLREVPIKKKRSFFSRAKKSEQLSAP